jgi:hypothetical protein
VLIAEINYKNSILFIAVPTEKSTIMKENFNRWYSVKSYYLSTTLIDLPISLTSVVLFSVIIYLVVGWPMEIGKQIFFPFKKIASHET